MFGWNDFGDDEKKGEKQERKWMRVVFGWEGEGEGERQLVGFSYFPSEPTKTLSPQIGKKTQGKTSHSFLDKP